jgi:hypothetical protein
MDISGEVMDLGVAFSQAHSLSGYAARRSENHFR